MTKKISAGEMECKNCGAQLKTKYLIRVIISQKENKSIFFESTSKRSIVGWIKFICNEHNFEEIEILNLLTECPKHQKFWENNIVKGKKYDN